MLDHAYIRSHELRHGELLREAQALRLRRACRTGSSLWRRAAWRIANLLISMGRRSKTTYGSIP